jgi:hypothetical protein
VERGSNLVPLRSKVRSRERTLAQLALLAPAALRGLKIER